MSSGSLPPVPDLIPIALLKSPAAMGEQRPRRSGSQTSAAESIDNSGKSRGLSAAPQPPPPQSRKRHHRKSDRRREHRKVASKTRARNSSTPPPPRVNPIFVWVRQEDTRIVDVKCEDYDKRNRILLTKTPQGWRAIPRTETLAPSLKEAADRRHHHRKHHHRPHKDKVKRKSTAVQVDGNISNTEEPDEDVTTSHPNSPTWNTPVNVESHLPSHKILVPQKCPSPSVNTVVEDSAQTQTEDNKCSVPKLCDISPLDNLLAVAEFEFNQQNWSPKSASNSISDDDQKDIIKNILQSCQENSDNPATQHPKSEECDYNEEDENNLAMDDILTRLEQSLQSPECTEIAQALQLEQINKEEEVEDPLPQHSNSVIDDQPTDLTFKPILTQNNETLDQPTDLSVPRPSSQNSEAIQSPQPSGIPAVPPSPDIITPSTKKSVFLESLLTTTSQKIALNSEVTIIKQNEPLDLGKLRKSASPTVTCSEQVDLPLNEPPAKKFKPTSQDITLKNLLDEETPKVQDKSTPHLLELLKTDLNETDPLTQLRQLLTDRTLNVPDPMLVPKEKLSLLISHPGKEIPRLLKQRPELRLPEALAFPHLLQDPDILVITLQQLETIILKQNQTLPLRDLKSYEKKPEIKENKKKDEVIQKSVKPFNELANDIDAATTAAFNQMLWLPYLNQLEAMSFAGDPQMMKLLSSPVYAPELVHLNRLPPNYNPVQPPQMNYNSSLELSMWQEAMLQANMLRPKPQNNFLDFNSKPKLAPPSNKHSIPNFFSNGTNSFMNMPIQSSKAGMPLPLYGHAKLPHKSISSQFAPKQKYSHKVEDKHRQRVASSSSSSSKSFSVVRPTSEQQQKPQPIDLSNVTAPKIRIKPHPLLKHDDVPEVGSTTASVEEMQDAHKHLWHPLFGNQKGYHNPWNWTTVTATGE